jgi:hypothetical protein
VLSIRNRYGNKPTTGVRGSVRHYGEDRDDAALDDLRVLAAYDADRLQAVLGNRQKSGGTPKAAAIIAAAAALVEVGVAHARDVDATSPAHRGAYCSVKGLGPVTWTYFTMLLGQPGVKGDTWIVRFVNGAVSRTVSYKEAEALVKAAATKLDVSPTELDHAIWRYMSKRRPTG